MGQLLSQAQSPFKSLQVGSQVLGTIIDIGPRSLSLDIGAKAEGLVSDREFDSASSYIKTLKVGDKIQAQVVTPETSSGLVLLSVKLAAQEKGWEELKKVKGEGRSVEAYILSAGRGGLTVSVFGIEGFIPTSQVSAKLQKNISNIVGRKIEVKVLEVDEKNQKLSLSEKAISEKELLEKQDKALKGIKIGERVKGKVVGLTSFGAFVQIELGETTIDGLVHLSELSWEKTSDASQILEVGQEIEVIVIGTEEGRLALSLKKTQKDPWEESLGDLKVDQKVKGKVNKLGDFGANIEIKPGIEGKIALSKIPDGVSLREGDLVDVFVENIDRKKRSITLGLVLTAKPVGYK